MEAPKKREYTHCLDWSGKNTGSKWHTSRNRIHRDKSHARLYCLQQMQRIRQMCFQGWSLRQHPGKTGDHWRNCYRFSGLLCRSQRVIVCPARPVILFLSPLVGLQTGSSRGSLPARWSKHDIRPSEQIFHHQQNAHRQFPILEQRTRSSAGRCGRRCRGFANHAHLRQ